MFHNALDFAEVVRQMEEGREIASEDLAHISPYLTEHINRFGEYSTHRLGIQPEAYDPTLDVDFTPLCEQDLPAAGFGTAAYTALLLRPFTDYNLVIGEVAPHQRARSSGPVLHVPADADGPPEAEASDGPRARALPLTCRSTRCRSRSSTCCPSCRRSWRGRRWPSPSPGS